ncbi:hypothetical protein Drorol1_Dr00001884 [Drosera rotundifolia]
MSITFNSSTERSTVTYVGESIETTITDKAAVIDQWWKPTYNPWTSNKAATLHLCIDAKCIIVQLFYVDYIPQTLKSFCSNPNFIFVGVEVQDDVAKLRQKYGLFYARNKDIRDHAMTLWPMKWYRRLGLKAIALDVVGLYMEKPLHVCRSNCSGSASFPNWEVRELSYDQIEYACIDAYVSYRIGRKLLIENCASF